MSTRQAGFGLAQRLAFLLVGVVVLSLLIVAAGAEYKRREYADQYRDVRARSAAALVYSARRLLVAVPPSQRHEIASELTASGTVQIFSASDPSAGPPALVAPGRFPEDVERLREAIARYATQPAEVRYGDDPSPRFWIKQFIDGEPWWVVVLMAELPQGSGNAPWAALLLVLSLVLLASGFYAASLTRPLERLAEAAARTGGEWPEPLELEGPRELQRVTDTFNAMVRRLKEMELERRVLLGGVPHDLRTPLTRLRMRIAMLPESSESQGLRADVVAMERIVRQFADYLDDRKDEEGRRSPLGAIAHDCVAAQRALGHDVTLMLHTDPAREAPDLLVRRILENLIGNALEHGRPPVEISISAEGEDRIAVQVSDRGSGIPESREQEARSPFVKLDRARSSAGCGLGLAIVQQLVGRSGGELRFSRENGVFAVVATFRA